MRRWRENAGDIAGIDTISFKSEIGRATGAAVDVQLSHRDTVVLDEASVDLADRLRAFDGVKDIDSGVALGKPQFNLELTPEGRSMGLTATDLATDPWVLLRWKRCGSNAGGTGQGDGALPEEEWPPSTRSTP